MATGDQLKNQHLLWRAGFGPAVEQLEDLGKYTPKEFYAALVKASAKRPEYINVADDYLQGLVLGVDQVARVQQQPLTAEEKRKRAQKNREGVRNLNLYWLTEMVDSRAQLREKMALFWHGHFACRNLNVFYQQGLLNVIRNNALGNFGTLLKEVSRSAAMLNFLNNQQNRKDHPNENFAREVMELFTLGRGNYTETDVKEAARAFTGWTANVKGEFVFRKIFHDEGDKKVLGQRGNLQGDDVLDILLDQQETALFICRKLYVFLVNDKLDEQKAALMADRFFTAKYDIAALLEFVFLSDWFYEPVNIGAVIKSPVALIAGIRRMVPMKLRNEESLIVIQRILGQMLFYPPNVAGWAGGRSWIDSSTLMMRLRLPQLFNDRDSLNVTPKSDDDTMMGKKSDGSPNVPPLKEPTTAAAAKGGGKNGDKGGGKSRSKGLGPIEASLDWSMYLEHFGKTGRDSLVNEMAALLLQTPRAVSAAVLTRASDGSGRESFIRSATIQLMSTPEYQLC